MNKWRRKRAPKAAAETLSLLMLFSTAASQQRPPLITDDGQRALDAWSARAARWSAEALPELVDAVADSNATNACVGLPCEGASPRELVDVLLWEFLFGVHLIHNGPLGEGGRNSDDSGLFTNYGIGYIENVWQRVVEDKEDFNATSQAMKDYTVETSYFDLPEFHGSGGQHPPGIPSPTWADACSRMLYLSANVWKKDIGAAIFGDTAYVISAAARDRILMAPVDTGEYALSSDAPKRLGMVMQDPASGNLTGFQHVVLDHIRFYGKQRGFEVGQWFRRWYGPRTEPVPPAMQVPYQIIEPNVMGSVWIPEHLLFQVARYNEVWGTPYAQRLHALLQDSHKGRPLVWADGETSGMLLDPIVGQVGDESVEPGSTLDTEQYRELWEKLWKARLGFAEAYEMTPAALRLFPVNYYNSSLCGVVLKCPECHVIGINGDGRCVFWRWNTTRNGQPPRQLRCCVHGMCVPCVNGVELHECRARCSAPAPTPQPADSGPSTPTTVVVLVASAGAATLCLALGAAVRFRRPAAAESSPLVDAAASVTPSSGTSPRPPLHTQFVSADSRSHRAVSIASDSGSIVGELRPGNWTMRVNHMRMDVSVYPEEAAAAE